jgi:glycosyltransferase involved in cell wall biosynthesis
MGLAFWCVASYFHCMEECTNIGELALSVVVPLYNESDSLEELHREVAVACDDQNLEWELVFVNDGSTDDSGAVAERIRAGDPRVKLLSFRANTGKAAALQAGFDIATGKIIITMDADLQDDPAEIPNLIAALENEDLDLVSGWKRKRHDPITKRLPSKLFNASVRFFGGLDLHDVNCGLKAYRREVIETLTIYGELHRFIPVLAAFSGFKVGEIPVNHRPRIHGHSKYGARRFISGFLDLLTVILLTRYTAKPLHFFGSAGLLSCLAGGLVNLYILIIWIESGFSNIQGRVPLFMGGVFLFLLGFQFISTGLLAELLTHNRMERAARDRRPC